MIILWLLLALIVFGLPALLIITACIGSSRANQQLEAFYASSDREETIPRQQKWREKSRGTYLHREMPGHSQ